jgi:hypothetical protein
MVNIKVICVDDANQPSIIPAELRVVKDEQYTVIRLINMGLQPGQSGVELKELNLRAANLPYEYYLARRFRTLTEEELAMEEAVEDLISETLEIV